MAASERILLSSAIARATASVKSSTKAPTYANNQRRRATRVELLTASCAMGYFDAQYGMRRSRIPFGVEYRIAGFLVKATTHTTGSVTAAETFPRSTAIAKTLK